MALHIETFDNIRGGNTLYKALTHPHVAAAAPALLARLARCGPAAIVDPDGAAAGFAEIFGLGGVDVAGIYVQDVARIGGMVLNRPAVAMTALPHSAARSVLVTSFDAARLIDRLQAYLPSGAEVFSLDAMRLPDKRLSNRRRYLDSLNFATNFAFFRDTGSLHTRLVTANYWAGYGADQVNCWLTLFDGEGK